MATPVDGMSPPGATVRLEVRIGLPPGWWQLPVGPDATADEVAAVVGARISPEWESERSTIVELAQATSAEAAAAGAVFAAQVGVEEGAESFSASLVVAFEAFAGIDDPDDLEALLRAADPAPDPSRSLERVTVGLIGPGLRRCTIGHQPDGTPTASIRYHAVVPGARRTVIVDCVSSDTADLEGLLALFGDIVDTLDVVVTEAAA